MKVKRLIPAVMAIALLGATACGNATQDKPEASVKPGATAAAALPPVTLKGMLFGDQPKDLQVVLDEFSKRTKGSLNTQLNIQFNPANDHKQKVKLMMAAGEEMDFVFDADFFNLRELIPQGAYQQLDKYFNNDKYPGLKKAFPPEFVEANKRHDGHLYTIPFTQYFDDLEVIYLRKDLREKYGLKPISNYDDLQKFLDLVQTKESGVTPLGLGGRTGWQGILGDERDPLPNLASVSVPGGGGYVLLSDDLKKVKEIVLQGDPASEYAKLPAPYNTLKSAHFQNDKRVEWGKYLEKDVMSQKDAKAYFMSGKAASYQGRLAAFAADRKKLKETIAGADLEYFVIRAKEREMKPHSISTHYRSNNALAIPVTSKNVDRTMQFFDWLFSSRENHDLFEFGIPGKHWEAVGDNQVKFLDESKNYNFPGYELTWNPTMIRLSSDFDETTKKYFEYSAKADTYYKGLLKSFVFDNSNVKAEFANVSSKYDPLGQLLAVGQVKDWEAQITKMNGELKALGLDKIRDEYKKQLQAYLDKGGK